MCKLIETVSEVNQIRTERHAHALEYLSYHGNHHEDRQSEKLRHLMSLYSDSSSPSFSLFLLFCFPLTNYYVSCQDFFSPHPLSPPFFFLNADLCFVVMHFGFLESNQTQNPYIRRLLLFKNNISCLCPSTSALPFLLSLFLLREQNNVIGLP